MLRIDNQYKGRREDKKSIWRRWEKNIICAEWYGGSSCRKQGIFHDSLDSLCLKEFTVYISFEQEKNPIKLTLFHKTYTLITQYLSWYSPLQISGEVVRLEGQPETSILAKAEEVQAAMIVMGSRGLGTIRRTILGSVSEYVLHHSHVPVMICKIKS